MKLQPTEYMYGSARVRAMENNILGREKLDFIVDAKSSAEAIAKLAEYGYKSEKKDGSDFYVGADAGSALCEDVLCGILSDAYAEVSDITPDPKVFEWFRYPYDCNNLKLAIKCFIRNIDPTDMLFDFGTVPACSVTECVKDGNFSMFPKNMAYAAKEAQEEFNKTGDPQRIDMLVDKACYEDMLACAQKSGEEILVGWIKAKIDLTNIMITLRVLRMRSGVVGRMFIDSACLTGGTIDKSFFLAVYNAGEETMWNDLYKTQYSKFAVLVAGKDLSLAKIEKYADDHWMETVKEAKWIPFGAPVLAGYLVAREYEVKNIRMILAAKDAGLSSDVIRERLRESYV